MRRRVCEAKAHKIKTNQQIKSKQNSKIKETEEETMKFLYVFKGVVGACLLLYSSRNRQVEAGKIESEKGENLPQNHSYLRHEKGEHDLVGTGGSGIESRVTTPSNKHVARRTKPKIPQEGSLKGISKNGKNLCPGMEGVGSCRKDRVPICRRSKQGKTYSTKCEKHDRLEKIFKEEIDVYCGVCGLAECTDFENFNVLRTSPVDVLELEGFDEDQVSWEVSGSSRSILFGVTMPVSLNAESERKTALEEFEAPAPSAALEPGKTSLTIVHQEKSDCISKMKAHLVLSSRVEKLCISGTCRPVLCPLSYDFDPKSPTAISAAPSNNQLLFGNSTNCTIVKPAEWDDWAASYFGHSDSLDSSYFADPDNDGLSNIIEYYGNALPSIFLSRNTSTLGRKLFLIPIIPSGMNPLKPDTDGDLLTDAFEWKVGTDSTEADDINEDLDGDGLTLFEEQKYGTSPFSVDTDGDGHSDYEEINHGSNPLNDLSIPGTVAQDTTSTVGVTLTVGDQSGSHSERYNLIVGHIVHQAPEFGVVSTATYQFSKGVYEVEIVHRDSVLSTPDFDYTAHIVPDPNSDLVVSVLDPEGILGVHYESSPFFADGKKAVLRVECQPGDKCCVSTCDECNRQDDCEWERDTKSCHEYSFFGDGFKDSVDDCPCNRCEAWATQELLDISWIQTLPQCPCSVVVHTKSLEALDDGTVEWTDDLNCHPGKNCGKFHPEAAGCIRASGSTRPHGQQCCYDSGGALLSHGSRSAGTPDKQAGTVSNWFDHLVHDVWPFNECCLHCEVESYCQKYIGTKEGDQGARSDPRECDAHISIDSGPGGDGGVGEDNNTNEKAILQGTPCQSTSEVGVCLKYTTCEDYGGRHPTAGLCPKQADDVKCCFGLPAEMVRYGINDELCSRYSPEDASTKVKDNNENTILLLPIQEEDMGNKDAVKMSLDEKDNHMTFRVACGFELMKAAAAKDGITLTIESAFRTVARQQEFYDCYTKICHPGCGNYSKKSGTCNLAAEPGKSNHGLGKALDITMPRGNNPIYDWLIQNAADFGFSWEEARKMKKPEMWHWTFEGKAEPFTSEFFSGSNL